MSQKKTQKIRVFSLHAHLYTHAPDPKKKTSENNQNSPKKKLKKQTVAVKNKPCLFFVNRLSVFSCQNFLIDLFFSDIFFEL